MIKVSVYYCNEAGGYFDMRYYCERHIPMVRELLGDACKAVEVEEGISGAAPGLPAVYGAIGHLYFDSVETFQAVFGPHADAIMADLPNYTNIAPMVQISRVTSVCWMTGTVQ